MKIAILGYGKMGKQIEEIALDRGHQITARFTSQQAPISQLQNSDIAIEFSTPQHAVQNIKTCIDCSIPVVVGTTGWYHQYAEVEEYVSKKNGTLLAATNFSVGVNISFFLNKIAARIMQNFTYAASIQEIHHTQKLDAPSGTAISLAQGIIENHAHFAQWELCAERSFALGNKVPIQALRQNDVPGTHSVLYKNDIDSIELIHTAFNRKGFASGAVDAAEWLVDRKGIFKIEDMFNFEQYL